MTLSEMLYGVLFQPVATLKFISNTKPLKKGLFIFAAVMALNMMINRGINLSQPGQEILPVLGPMWWVFGCTGIVISLLLLFIMAGTLSLLGEFIYHKANGSGLFVGLLFASLPGVLGPPLQYASILIGAQYLGTILAFLALVWVIILEVIAVREALQLTTGEAVFLLILPVIAILLVGAGMVFIAASLANFNL